ncbi:hypothetical protein [Streptomyces sp. ALI-76-A]|uniref:hypothetical protein n=1 Tax=Streptomyces sp. ALI-76-A TaxID=3025736 RepID=UPI00256EA32E|nr:hypothetical protein [Streptomyces sp. ALI-76-A]MDL5203509.1 hypothetical protein [Streptomyces sp. ALI-76-A]
MIRVLPPARPYPRAALGHRFVGVDASDVLARGRAGAHSDRLRPESAHLPPSLSGHCR